jgi:hypothetical protein
VAGEEDGALEERRKRRLGESEFLRHSTPEEHLNKRSKGNSGKNLDGVAANDSPIQTISRETTPQPKTSSPTLTTPSSVLTIEVVCQSSIVPRL